MNERRKIYLNGTAEQASHMLQYILQEHQRLEANPSIKSFFETEEQYQNRMANSQNSENRNH